MKIYNKILLLNVILGVVLAISHFILHKYVDLDTTSLLTITNIALIETIFIIIAFIANGFFARNSVRNVKRSESSLALQLNRLNGLLNVSNNLIAYFNIEGKCELCNKKLKDYLEINCNANLSIYNIFKNHEYLLPEEVKVKLPDFDSTITYIAKNKNHSFEVSIIPIMSINNNLKNYAFFAKDITEISNYNDELMMKEENLAVTLESIGDAVIVTDTDSNIIRMNNAAERITAVNRNDALGKQIDQIVELWDVVNEKKIPANMLFIKGFPGSKSSREEIFIKGFDGKQHYVNDTITQVRKKNGEVIGTVYVFSDITSRQELLKELQISIQRLERAQEVSKTGYFEIDLRSFKVKASTTAKRIYGLNVDSDTVEYKDIINQRYREDYHIPDQAMSLMLKNHLPFDINYRIIRASDGEVVWINNKSSIELDSNGTPVKIYGFIQDITFHKNYEIELKRQRDLLQLFIDCSPVALAMLDNKYRYLQVSNAYLRNFDFTINNVLGKQVFDHHPSIEEDLKDLIDNSVLQNKMFTAELLYNSENSEWMRIYIHPWTDFKENIGGAIVFFENITVQKKWETSLKEMNIDLEQNVIQRTSQLEQAYEELKWANFDISRRLEQEQQLNELKTRFVSMVSHEFRTPLTVILSSTYILSKAFEIRNKVEFDKYLSRIQSSIENMTHLLEDVLTIGKTDTETIKTKISKYNISEIVKSCIEEQKLINKKKQTFALEINTTDLELKTDSYLLSHAISNILANASKYSPENSAIACKVESDKFDHIIQISDKGIGIPDADKHLVFEPFHRSKNIGATEGTGLGLTITKKFIESLDGSITFESEQNKGTTFIIRLSRKF